MRPLAHDWRYEILLVAGYLAALIIVLWTAGCGPRPAACVPIGSPQQTTRCAASVATPDKPGNVAIYCGANGVWMQTDACGLLTNWTGDGRTFTCQMHPTEGALCLPAPVLP